jgi:putative membrane protein
MLSSIDSADFRSTAPMTKFAAYLGSCAFVLAFPALAADSSFIEKAAQGGMAEVEAGELAANKATNSDVRKFAMMMVKDHGAANQKLAQLAKSEGVPLPDTYGEAHRSQLKALQAVDGPRFDQAYMAQMVKAHEETVHLLKSEIASGQDPEIRAYAESMLPTVESHLREAYRLTGRENAPMPGPQ